MSAQHPKTTTTPSAIDRAKASLDAARRDLESAEKDTARPAARPYEPPPRQARFTVPDAAVQDAMHAAAVFLAQRDGHLYGRARTAVRDRYGRPGVALSALAAVLSVAQRSAASAAEYEGLVPDVDYEPTATETDYRLLREAMLVARKLLDVLDVHA